ncbi:hypothetical protein Rhe02_81660 [Rhizocola hellebori]|uniref:PPM-type phosphatase domain-containing protein n=1 Tax=Rhizocola hellebori TaxID=1392758 RepID=A0A8J3QI23_9ACTN|nr:protein phosphatase 2C domain-containing protein [Rhizocola hellebori]GIH10099.1 hypothetical protein Rhe02_81660 [Rhizocola hellebori]
MGFVLPTVRFAGLALVVVLLIWAATFIVGRSRRSKRRPARAEPMPRWALPHEPALPAIAADLAQIGDLAVRAASIVGPANRSHQPGMPRQDAYRLAQDSASEHLIIAVADGALPGGRPGLGANLATTTVVNDLRRQLDLGIGLERLTAADVFGRVAQSMVDGAQLRGISMGSLYTTLVAMVIPTAPTRGGERTAWLAYLGHSSAWVNLGSRWQNLTADVTADTSATLPFQPELAAAALVDLPPKSVVAITTDGLAAAFSKLPQGQSRFAHRWRHPRSIGSFLLDVDFPADTAGTGALTDDRTAVIVWCGAA